MITRLKTNKDFIDGYDKGYADALDEFVELINTMPTYENEYGEIMPMPVEMMAEQLKGAENEQQD